MKHTLTKQGPAIILKGSIIFTGLVALALCTFVLPRGIFSDKTGDYWPILVGLYVAAIPFFVALYQALKLLGYLDKNKAFSKLSVRALKNIKYCAAVISALFAAGMPYIYYVADKDDAPGVVALGLVIAFAAFVIATATAVLQQLVQNAVDIKSENDLTV